MTSVGSAATQAAIVRSPILARRSILASDSVGKRTSSVRSGKVSVFTESGTDDEGSRARRSNRLSAVVGIVIVSHSEALAEGVVALAREMGGEELALEAAGGMDEPGALGTDAERVRAAIERAMSDDGVLVLMDLGSALMSAEFA